MHLLWLSNTNSTMSLQVKPLCSMMRWRKCGQVSSTGQVRVIGMIGQPEAGASSHSILQNAELTEFRPLLKDFPKFRIFPQDLGVDIVYQLEQVAVERNFGAVHVAHCF
jgi:hypothetical protein